jgi:ATP-binding cassette subfamily C protein
MLDIFRKLFAFLDRRTRIGVALLLLAAIVVSGLEMIGVGLFLPLLQMIMFPEKLQTIPIIGQKLHEVFLNPSAPLMALTGLLVFLFIAAKNAFILLIMYLQRRFIAYSETRFRTRVYASYLRRPYDQTLHLNSAAISRNLMRSVPQMFSKALLPIIDMIMEGLIALGAIAALLLIEPIGSLLALILLSVTLLAFYLLAQQKLSRWGRELEDTSTSMYRWISEGLGGLKETKVLARESFFEGRFLSSSLRYARFSHAVATIQQVPRLLGEVLILAVMFMIIAIIASRNGSITDALPVLGVFAAASLRLLPSLSRIVQAFSTIRQASSSVNYVYDELHSVRCIEEWASAVPAPRPHDAIPFCSNITVRGLCYRYPGAAQDVLRDISFTLNKGEMLAIVGPSGSGKTTLVDLLLGLLEPTAGTIEVDGVDVRQHMPAWRRQIGFVSQQTHILDETLPRNVAFGVDDDHIDMDRVKTVLKQAHLDDTLCASLGFDTPVGELGKRLSGGQRQRLGIARALYENPSVLILDEATSALDNVTAHEVSQSISDLSTGKTLIVIAHRLATIKRANRLIYIEGGRALACGTYDELISNCAPFRRQIELGSFDMVEDT